MKSGKLNKKMSGFSLMSDQDKYYDSNINPYESRVTEWGMSLTDKEHWTEYLEECSDDAYLWLKNSALNIKNNLISI